MTSVNLNYFLKAPSPSTIMLEVRALIYESGVWGRQTHFSLSPQVSGAWAGHVSARVPPGSASTLHSSFLRSCHPGAFCSDAKPQFSSSKKEIHGACPDTQRIGHQEPAAQPVHTQGPPFQGLHPNLPILGWGLLLCAEPGSRAEPVIVETTPAGSLAVCRPQVQGF